MKRFVVELPWVREARINLACAAMSLMSYEQSYGGGGGMGEAFDIARFLGYEGDPDAEDIMAWLRQHIKERKVE